MSHNATNWAIRQRGLKPATKLVLWQLCDRHNPDQGCFPSQEKLAHDCEMSRSSLNDHLNILEDRGLIRRDQRVNEATRRQQSTSYIFAFEEGFVCANQQAVPQDVDEP
ncbi:MAG: helix-turn-helix domain-containing protein, partial [Pararhizobium sp.]